MVPYFSFHNIFFRIIITFLHVIKIQSTHTHTPLPAAVASHCQIPYRVPAPFPSECVVKSDTQDLCKKHSLTQTTNFAALVIFWEHQWDLTDREYLFQLFKISKTNSNSYFLGTLHIHRYIFIMHSKQDLHQSYSSLAIPKAIKLDTGKAMR